MTNRIDCERAQELFSDDADGSLHSLLRADLHAHLESCDTCSRLRPVFDEVVQALRAYPELEPSADLAAKAANAALRAGRGQPERAAAPRATRGPALFRIAAALLLLGSGVSLLAAGPNSAPTRAANRLVERTSNTADYLAERRDRLMEDIRILRVVISAAFEGRMDQVNDRFDDYRRVLEKRRAAQDQKKSGKILSNSVEAALVPQYENEKERQTT